jgi:MFS family permease
VQSRPGDSQFGWLWAAFAVSTFGTWVAFDAFPIVAILALHARPIEVSLLAAAGLAVGAVVAVPLGPWVERRRKRRVMIAMDCLRFLALASVPAAYALGWLRFGQLLVAAVVVGTADICFRAASGACMKALVAPEHLLTANARFESTTWTATMIGPPLGGALIGIFGPVTTVLADAASYLLSALGVSAIARHETRPVAVGSGRRRRREVFEGWRYIVRHPPLRSLLVNTAMVNGLIMAPAPLVAVLMLGRLHIPPWQYGLAFAAPCLGGLIGARLARRLTVRYGQLAVLRRAGALRACWSLGLAFIPGGWAGVGLVALIQFGLVTCCGVFNPVSATYRLEQTPDDRLARTLAAWTITTKLTVAGLTATWGVLASVAGLRTAIGLAGVVLLATPLLLPTRSRPHGTAQATWSRTSERAVIGRSSPAFTSRGLSVGAPVSSTTE